MKHTLFILLMILSLGAAAQDFKYVITGYQYDKEDLTYMIVNSNSTIQTSVTTNLSTLNIYNDAEKTRLSGIMNLDKDNPDKTVQKDATHYQSILYHRIFDYIFENTDKIAKHTGLSSIQTGDVSLIFVFKPTSIIINCSIFTQDGHVITYSGYRIDN